MENVIDMLQCIPVTVTVDAVTEFVSLSSEDPRVMDQRPVQSKYWKILKHSNLWEILNLSTALPDGRNCWYHLMLLNCNCRIIK